jgi:hypothetical protein
MNPLPLPTWRYGAEHMFLYPRRWDIWGKIADALNDLIKVHEKMDREFVRVSHAIGKEVRLRST